MIRWEYRIEIIEMTDSGTGAVVEMNNLGNQGWEVVNALPYSDDYGGKYYLFKRPMN